MPILILMILLLAAPPVGAATYRWVDEDGNVHYGDRIPPKYAKQEREELNDQGVVTDRSSRKKTPAEVAREKAEAEARAKAEAEAAEQARIDKFLLSTYATQDQLIARRDEQLAILDGRIASAEGSVAQSESTLNDLKQRAAKLEQKDKPVPKNLAQQIEEFEAALAGARRALAAMRGERQNVAEEFARDLARYREITR